MSSKVNETLMKEIHDAFNARDVDRIANLFAEDGIFATARGPHPYGQRYQGRKAIKDFLAWRYSQIADMSWEHKYRYTAGNHAVSYWVVKGKYKDGRELNLNGCDLYDFNDDGKIVYKDTFWKTIE